MLQKIIILLLCSAAVGALAFFGTLQVIGPTHNIGVLFGALLAAGISAVATAIGGWYWYIR